MKIVRTSPGWARLLPAGGLGALVVMLAVCSGGLQAQLVESFTFNESPLSIPDGDPVGVSDTHSIQTAITDIISLQLSLQLSSDLLQDNSGAFNGDLYLYLRHDSGFAVLLNRPGRSGNNPAGYPDAGLSITLRDDAPSGDLHFYGRQQSPALGLPLTGSWQPDGRALDPDAAPGFFDTAARPAVLGSFSGLNPNGLWVLYAADLQSGAAAQIDSWTLEITGVPEPSQCLLGTALTLAAFALLRCRRHLLRSEAWGNRGNGGTDAD